MSKNAAFEIHLANEGSYRERKKHRVLSTHSTYDAASAELTRLEREEPRTHDGRSRYSLLDRYCLADVFSAPTNKLTTS